MTRAEISFDIHEKPVLVTGANGFIGRAVSKRLKQEGVRVRDAVRTISNTGTEWLSPTLGGEADWRPLLEGAVVVIHTAARAHVLNELSSNPLAEFRIANTLGTLSLAQQAAEMKVKRFVFLSSIGVNGTTTTSPFKETDTPCPSEPYALSKLESEMGLLEISEKTGMEVVVIRPPLVYGPNAPGNFGRLAKAVKSGIPLPFGSITKNRRSLVGLDNLVDLIFTCVFHPAAANQIFIAGDGEDLSTADLIRRMALAFQINSRLLPCPVGLLESMARAVGRGAMINRLCGSLQVDIGKSHRVLGWQPPFSLDQGLKKVAEGIML